MWQLVGGAKILKIEISRVSFKVGHAVVSCKMKLKERKIFVYKIFYF